MAFRAQARVCLGLVALSLLRCGGDSNGDDEPVLQLSLVSFNAALGVGLAPFPEQRLEAIEADLPELRHAFHELQPGAGWRGESLRAG